MLYYHVCRHFNENFRDAIVDPSFLPYHVRDEDTEQRPKFVSITLIRFSVEWFGIIVQTCLSLSVERFVDSKRKKNRFGKTTKKRFGLIRDLVIHVRFDKSVQTSMKNSASRAPFVCVGSAFSLGSANRIRVL